MLLDYMSEVVDEPELQVIFDVAAERQTPITSSPRSLYIRHNSRPMPRLQPVTNTFIAVILRCSGKPVLA
jgi:hypothetical protein